MCVTAPVSDIQLQVGVSSMSDRPVAEVSNAADAAEYVDRTVISRLRFLPLLGAVVFVPPLPRRTPVLPLTYPPTHPLTHSLTRLSRWFPGAKSWVRQPAALRSRLPSRGQSESDERGVGGCVPTPRLLKRPPVPGACCQCKESCLTAHHTHPPLCVQSSIALARTADEFSSTAGCWPCADLFCGGICRPAHCCVRHTGACGVDTRHTPRLAG
jgi:hypothetical protein